MASTPTAPTISTRGRNLRAARFALAGAWQRQRPLFLVALALTILAALLPYAINAGQALLLNELVRIAGTAVDTTTVLWIVGGIGALFLVKDGISAVHAYFDRQLWYSGAEHRQVEYSTKMLSLDYATHEDPSFQDELQVLNEYSSTYVIPNFLDQILSSLMNVVGFIAAALIVLAIDWRLFLLIVAATAPRLIAEVKLGNSQWGFFSGQSGQRRKFRELDRHLGTSRGIAELQTLQAEDTLLERMRSMLGSWFTGHIKQERKRAWYVVLTQVIATSAVITAFVVLVTRAVDGELQIGTLVLAITSITGLQGSASAFFAGLGSMARFARPTAAYQAIMERSRTIALPVAPVRMAPSRPPVVEFRDVSFAYPGTPDRMILDRFSLTINPGERLAIIGVNGAGKTTLMRLMHRFYDPTAGAILIDGVDLRDIALNDWYAILAYLGQDFATFNFPVAESIGFGSGRSEADDVVAAAVAAEADPFIRTWKDGYAQQIGTHFGGIDPSGGQRQKIALARSMHRHALITVLDEPTAHMDAAAEEAVFGRLYREADPNSTVIVISHRFSTIRGADRICVVDDGRVVEMGSHDELVTAGGTYASLFSAQSEHYK